MKQILCVLLLLCLSLKVPAQDKPPGKQVGDKLPNIEIHNILGRAEKIRLDRGFVIIEFISTGCGTCIRSIGEMERLKETFGKDLQVLLVSSQKKEVVQKAIDRHGWKLPVIAEDTLLKSLFPHQSVPHQVWLRDGEVVDITYHYYATAENIRKAMAVETVQTLPKKDTHISNEGLILSPDLARPLFTSVISERIPGGRSFMRQTDSSYLMYNINMLEMYSVAFKVPRFPVNAYIVWEVSDSLRHAVEAPAAGISGDYDMDIRFLEWQRKYTFCYNLVFPSGTYPSWEVRRSVMQSDFNNFFRTWLGIEASMEKSKVTCLALIHDDSVPLSSQGGAPAVVSSDTLYRLVNQPLRLMVSHLSYGNARLGVPVIDASGYEGRVDLEIAGGLTDIIRINSELQKYGLSLRTQVLELDMLVIREVGKNRLRDNMLPSSGSQTRNSN